MNKLVEMAYKKLMVLEYSFGYITTYLPFISVYTLHSIIGYRNSNLYQTNKINIFFDNQILGKYAIEIQNGHLIRSIFKHLIDS